MKSNSMSTRKAITFFRQTCSEIHVNENEFNITCFQLLTKSNGKEPLKHKVKLLITSANVFDINPMTFVFRFAN